MNYEQTPANAVSAVDSLIDDVNADEVAALDQWLDSGGLDLALTITSPYLRENASAFVAPDNQFIAASLPAEVEADAAPETVVEALRPYLLGERRIPVPGGTGDLFALILIPEDVDQHIVRPGIPPSQNSGQAGIQYWARNLTDSRLPDAIAASINSEIRNSEYIDLGVSTQ